MESKDTRQDHHEPILMFSVQETRVWKLSGTQLLISLDLIEL